MSARSLPPMGREPWRPIDPMANLRALAQPPQGRPRVIREQNPETLQAALVAGQMKLAGKPEDAQITVEGVDVNIAAARMAIGPVTTYLHLALTDGKVACRERAGLSTAAGREVKLTDGLL